MPYLKTYNLFISHAWAYGESYNRLINLLNQAPYFSYKNYSAPEDHPLHTLDHGPVRTKSQIMSAIDRKIAPAHCILVLSGMYTNHSEWMQYELETAVWKEKPIIGIRPFGSTRTPSAVESVADVMVSWNTNSIISAIRDLSL
nr:MAG TPA: TIR-like domain protein [Caudoviricetes sp.]